MSGYKLYAYPHNPNATKALIAAQFGGIKIDYPQDFKMGTENKTPEFLKKFPPGQVPAMDTPDGPLFESNALARYVARKGDRGLLGGSDYEQSLVDAWIEYTRSKIEAHGWPIVGPIYGFAKFDQQKSDDARNGLKNAMTLLDGQFAERQFLVGNRITLADIVVFCTFNNVRPGVERDFVTPFPNFFKWFTAIAATPQVKAVVGDVEFPEKAAPPKA
eukprot:TRINITY_DN302_c0_g1_i1.p1 TRINITY_DN302_c0_g1~~TRINITY_DN302_c0_g1_i1.p1  ORF type:complete len:217 (-),score=38.62 TRINITY_DN302_c0_g1_i1:131-781(-)